MQNKFFKSEGEKQGILAQSFLGKSVDWFNKGELYGDKPIAVHESKESVPIIVMFDYAQHSSMGASAYSDEIKRNINSVFYGYLVSTSRNWAEQYNYSNINSSNAVELEFNKLAEDWRNATMFESNINKISIHPSYQRIIGMGRVALPFIFREMSQSPGHWFWALKSITGVDPVDETMRGDVLKMTESWIRWGELNGYC